MKNTVQPDLLQEVARMHGVNREEVQSGIREAIVAARLTGSDMARAFWETLPEDATETEIVLQIAKLICVE